MVQRFSSMNRQQYLQEMAKSPLDVLIIGGGITGAGIAIDAITRGLKVGLIEMNDFASGTSSRSTKLIHGGLRYLKQMDVKLVAEVGRERAVVYKNAPHVTTPVWMLLPMIRGGTYGKAMTSLGLKTYDWLARVKKDEQRKMLSKEETLKIEPLLREDILVGSGFYVEYVTDDARLTIEVLKEAVDRGALAVNYVKASKLLYQSEKLVGVKAMDMMEKNEVEIYAKKIVNATGPWVDELREKDHSKVGKHLYVTKGIHIVVPHERFPIHHALYFDNDDERMIFAIPKKGKTYIGTTDTPYKDNLENPSATIEDCEYLLRAIQNMFPKIRLKMNDIESSWAGVRPLIHEEGKSPSEISRKDEIFQSSSGLISIAGGKLTGYRKMAERVVDIICAELEIKESCKTENIKLSGGSFKDFEQYEKMKVAEGVALGLQKSDVKKLISRYGNNIDVLFSYAKQRIETDALTLSVLYSVHEEMCTTLSDFFMRRTGDLYFDIPYVKENYIDVSIIMKELCNWDEDLYNLNVEELKKRIVEAQISE
jgi:glycerol-3-phosphate dehydrogenase